MFPIQRLDRPKTCRVSNGDTENPLKLEIDIPIRGDITIAERHTVEEITKKDGLSSLEPLIQEIAKTTAEHNGNDPVKIATKLLELREVRGRTQYGDPVEDYRGYFLMHSREMFNEFEQKLVSGDVDKCELAAGALVMLKRAAKTNDFDPAKIKVENLLDASLMPSALLQALYHLYLIENSNGTDISKYLDKDGYFSLKHMKEDEKEQEKAEKEPVEAVAGK